MLDFDTMLLQVGEFGLYQKILFLFEAPFAIFVTFTLFGQVFMVLYPMNYWCDQHFACITIDSNATAAQRRNISFMWRPATIFESDPCEVNFVDDDFLMGLHEWNERSCASGPQPCNFPNGTGRDRISTSGRPTITSQRDVRSEIVSHLSYGENSQENDFEIHSRKIRSYGQYAARSYASNSQQWQRPRPINPTTTATTTTTEETYDGEFGGDEWGKERQYGPSSTGGGGSYSNWGGGSGSGTYGSQGGGSSWNGNRGPSYGSGGGGNGGREWETTTPRQQTTTKPGGSNESPSTGKSSQKPGQWEGTSGQVGARPSNQRTPLNSAFTGWPIPSCKRNRGPFEFRLTNNTVILADRLNGRARNNNSYGTIKKHCIVRWNLSEVPYPTIVTDGNWWCNAEAYTTISQAVFFLGAIVGGFLIGWIADTFGRVPALVIANILGALGGALSAVSTNIVVFCIFRFITGMAFDNCFTMMYILVLEFCGPTYRTLVANLSIAIFYTLGTLLIPLLAWLISNWRTYALVISLPMLLALLALFFVPESARWLLSKGRAKEATNILRNFAKVNRRKVDEHVFVNFEQEATALFAQLEQEEEEPSLAAAFRTPRLRRTFFILIGFWSLIALVYDGHSRNIINLANEELNVFWMFGIASMTELPADLLLIFTLDRFGRRWLAFGSMTLSGVFSIIAAAITAEMRVPFLITAIISRFWVNVAFNIGLQYAAELLPTVIRAQGVNAIHIMGYVASIISPFVAAIGRSNPALSLILLGAFSLAAGFLSLFLAETLGEDLPNTLEEAEEFGKNQSFWNCPICSKEVEEEWPVSPPPAALAERPVVLRNALRGSIRGETYRSSMLSNASSGGNRRSQYMQLGQVVHTAPNPTEATRLRRITH